MNIYKIIYVITEKEHPGAIISAHERPQPGDQVKIGSEYFEVFEIFDLIPPQGNFYHVQANCRPLDLTSGKEG